MAEYNHTLTSPLIAVTSALAAIAWLILFIGACVVPFHGVSWFIIIYELVVVVGIIVILGINVFEPYRNMAYLFLAISIVYLTWLVQLTLDANYEGGARAATAGSIILIIVEFIWAFELTAPGGGTWMSRGSFDRPKAQATHLGQKFTNSVRPNEGGYNDKKPLPRHRDEEAADSDEEVLEQATALHGYNGSSEDPNELSFSKDEVIDILDKRGNWWRARKEDGTTGIVPSNYF